MSATATSDLGSFPYWIQEEVSVRLREPVTEFQLTVKVARSGGVASTGYWTTYDSARFDVTVAALASTVTYIFTLKPGHSLPAGNGTLAVQFNHATVHNPATDTYTLSAASSQQHAAVRGEALGAFSSAGSGSFVSGDDASKCMDDDNDSWAAGSKVQMWDCNAGPAQDWTAEPDGTIQINGNCLDIYHGGTTNGSLAETWTCNGYSDQQWKLENGTLVNPASGKCLDDPAGNTDDGTPLDIWACDGSPNQKWTLP